jgi:hypothetical protein
MSKENFIEKRFGEAALYVIEQANRIIASYQAQGFTLTLRQLYYQFVSRDLIPNKQSEYKRLGSIINDARLAGLIDWSSIEDRTRNVRKSATWSSPSEIIHAVSQQYKEDLWAGQRYRPEVWIEKDALIGVIEPVCERYRVPYFSCRGYSSQSEQYAAGQRFSRCMSFGQKPIVLHLGDHDPSGIDMTRDNAERLSMFSRCRVEVRRLALNMEQIDEYNPPPNPAKESDSRSSGYMERFGDSSWELDALDPIVIDRLIASELDSLILKSRWKRDEANEETRRNLLGKAALNWPDVEAFLRS